MNVVNTAGALNDCFYPEAVGTLTDANTDPNALPGVSLGVDDLGYIKQGKPANRCEGGFEPTQAQLDAMNSGITSEDVEQISTNKNNILSIQTPITGDFVLLKSGKIDTKIVKQINGVVYISLYITLDNPIPTELTYSIGYITGVNKPIAIYTGSCISVDNYDSAEGTECRLRISGASGNIFEIVAPTGTTTSKYIINLSYPVI